MPRLSSALRLGGPFGRKALGIAFLCLLVLFGWLTHAAFTQKFVDVVPVTLKASKVGLQMGRLADVKIRGVIVGEVRELRIDGDGEGAVLELAMDPEKVDSIPANVTAVILPKTLFGEKFVSLQVPDNASPESLSAGDVIRMLTPGGGGWGPPAS